MTFEELCSRIALDGELEKRLTFGKLSAKKREALCVRLCGRDYAAAARELEEADDTGRGLVTLAVMLRAALLSREIYERRGIAEEVFFDTMKCFSRFAKEYRVRFGEWGFDRGFWTGRQLSLSLFRLGTLEYELAEDKEGAPAIAVHIPSDADLSDGAVDDSLARARAFFSEEKSFGRWKKAPYTCDSWLLSPALKELLPPRSRILRFQARFSVIRVSPEDGGFLFWLFEGKTSPDSFPQETSLQRAAARYLAAGGKIGSAFGRLKESGERSLGRTNLSDNDLTTF